MNRIPFCATALALSLAPGFAQEADPEKLDPYEWVIETYQFPANTLVDGFATEERGALRAPEVPAEGASEEEIREFIRKSNSVVTHYLEDQGLSLPKGGLVLFDPESYTLTARLPRIAQSSVAFTADAYRVNISHFIELNPVIVEAPAATMRDLVVRSSTMADHTELLDELEAAAGQGDAAFLYRGRIDANSGQRVKLDQALERNAPTDFALVPEGGIEYGTEIYPEGTTWEFDTVLGADETTLDINLMVDHHYAPSIRRQVGWASSDDLSVSRAVTEMVRANVTSQYTMRGGTTRLLGSWKPEQVPAANGEETLQAAFLRADVVRVLPLINEDLAGYLREHGDAIEPIPEGRPEFEKIAEEIPEGMIVRRFRIPPTFLSSGAAVGESVPADPFAEPVSSEPRFTIRATAKDILQSAGIGFPAGSSANYLPATSTLVIRNTPENIELVEAYVMSIRTSVARSISVTAHVVQGPGALIREAARNSRALADHVREWERLQGQQGFAILGTYGIQARSGQRAKVEAGRDYYFPASVEWGRTTTEEKGGGGKDDNQEGEAGTLTGELDMERIGTRIEIDPILGVDGHTIDLNFSLVYDYGPPSTAGEAARGEGSIQLEGPITTFHRAKVATSSTYRGGMTRMVAMWKPSGTPEFDGADILQAVFVKVDVFAVEEVEEE